MRVDNRQSGILHVLNEKKSFMLATDFEFEVDNQNLMFHIPLPKVTELFLSIAQKSSDSYKEKDNEIGRLLSSEYKNFPRGTLITDSKFITMIYDLFEESYKCLTFSAMTLESFANNLIPNDYVDKKGRTKEEIERTEKLINKLKIVIPDAFNIPAPTNQPWWQDLVKVIKNRNELVHFKYHAVHSYIEAFTKPLFLRSLTPLPETIITVIQYYCKECQIEGGLFLPDILNRDVNNSEQIQSEEK
ncbi:MAG TPA: hypothetical protein PLW09_04830 [Candidatus Kapabacteria bacterium]|nr:hypothetical protein [Candidatus Kapabacteria bacterium]